VRDRRRIDPETGELRQPAGASAGTPAGTPARTPPKSAASDSVPDPAAPSVDTEELEQVRRELGERTADLQRLTAEYANYRKRVDRDRTAVTEIARASILSDLVPVLDDIDRAREHGDLTGALKAIAGQLDIVLNKAGLEPFGDIGDPFDPTLHEAVMHSLSPDVTEPTCVQVLRRGYRVGERLLRPAMVAVAEPDRAVPPSEPSNTEEPKDADAEHDPGAGEDAGNAD
jgi:molecular chaperone GrpE